MASEGKVGWGLGVRNGSVTGAGCGCPLLASARGQAGWGCGQLGLVGGGPVHGGGASNQVLKVPSTPNHAVDPIPIPCSVRARRRGRGPLPTWCRCPTGRGGERHREQGGAGQEPRPARGQRDGADPPHHHPQLRRLVRLQQVRGRPRGRGRCPAASPARCQPPPVPPPCSVHAIERRALPEFFNGKNKSKTPEM